MRYIDIDFLELSLTNEWKEKAQKAQSLVRELPSNERAKAINDFNDIWRGLKRNLKELSHEKCWYCETSTHRILGDVDHHRPKNKVEKCSDHPGYWWLAFEWRNYRFACELCNRLNKDTETSIVGGKGSYFPLLDSKKRIMEECDYDDLLAEDPILLDPIVAEDPALLTFDLDGTARPVCDEGQCPEDYKRAKVSIELYHLNHTDLKKRRQLEIGYKVSKLVKEVEKNLPRWQKDRSNLDARVRCKKAVEELKKMIHERHEYSAAAIAVLKTYRTPDRRWIEDLLSV